MSIIVQCPIEIKSSGKKNLVGLTSENAVCIVPPYQLNNVTFLGLQLNQFNVCPLNHQENPYTKSFLLDIEIKNNVTPTECIIFLQNLAKHFTILLSQHEENPANGFVYAEIDLFRLQMKNSIQATTHTLDISGSVSTILTSHFSFSENQWNIDGTIYSSLIMNSYYDGIKANEIKSKFFHWFLILEYLETFFCNKEQFAERLFTNAEIETLAKSFQKNTSKYNAIMNLKSRYKKTRADRLCGILKDLGLNTYQFQDKAFILSQKTLKTIINYRNGLFHKSTQLDESLVWNHLYPIVREIVGIFIKNPKILE